MASCFLGELSPYHLQILIPISLKYHRLHPEYIHQRIERMKNMYNARILLVHSDIVGHPQLAVATPQV